jgi:hypothetical protein
VMNVDNLLRQARDAARELRSEGSPVLPLAEAFHLDAPTARLLGALVSLGILLPGEVPGVFASNAGRAAA